MHFRLWVIRRTYRLTIVSVEVLKVIDNMEREEAIQRISYELIELELFH